MVAGVGLGLRLRRHLRLRHAVRVGHHGGDPPGGHVAGGHLARGLRLLVAALEAGQRRLPLPLRPQRQV